MPTCVWAQTGARGYDLRVVTGDAGQVTREIVQSIQRLYPMIQESSDPKSFSARKGTPVYLTIGPSALRSALSTDLDAPIVSLFTSSQIYTELIAGARPKRPAITAIYAEASPLHQMELITELFGKPLSVGVLLTDSTAYLRPLLRQAADSTRVNLTIEHVARDENVVRALARIGPVGAILAVPDSTLYTPASVRTILESAYRSNKAVVGFSTGLVNAGAVATAYSTIDDTLAQLPEILSALMSAGRAEPQYPRYWRVAINENVARSLFIIVSDRARGLGQRPVDSRPFEGQPRR